MKIITVYGEIPRTTEIPNSMTLSSAILYAIALNIEDAQLKQMINDFLGGNPPFVVSNAMPLLKVNGDTIRFYPAPNHDFLGLKKLRFKEIEEYRFYKDLHRIRYIPEDTLLSIINGDIIEDDEIRMELLDLWEKLSSKLKRVSTIHTAIARIFGKAAEGMLFSNIVYRLHELRIFFYIAYNDIYEKEVLRGIRILADLGIGGKRTWGLGKIKNLRIESKYPEKLFKGSIGEKTYFYLLSDVAVSDGMDLAKSYYNVLYRRAVVSNIPHVFMKKGYFYLAAGGIIKMEGHVTEILPRLAILGEAIPSGSYLDRNIIEIGYGLGIPMVMPHEN